MFRLSYVLLKVVIADSSEIEIKEPNEIIKINLKYITINSISESYIKGMPYTRNKIFILLWTSYYFYILMSTLRHFYGLLRASMDLGGVLVHKIFF